LLAPGRSGPNDQLAAWLRERTDKVFISAVTVTEIEQGIYKLRRTGATERANCLLCGWIRSSRAPA
jgi:predicted nucleic acid-binding protein